MLHWHLSVPTGELQNMCRSIADMASCSGEIHPKNLGILKFLHQIKFSYRAYHKKYDKNIGLYKTN